MEHLFVYGSLAKGRKNDFLLERIGGKWNTAFVIGRLTDQGWAAEMGYPGLILDDYGGKIDGFLFSSADLNSHWKKLDSFEGTDYERVLTNVYLGKKSISAFVYVLKEH